MTRIGILTMTDIDEPAHSVHGDYLAIFEHFLRGQPVDLHEVAVYNGDAPASLTDADVWVISGSKHSVYDPLDWIPTAVDITRSLIAEERPTVGICFGHQLIAYALDGRVEATGSWGLGAQRYDTITPLPWLSDHGSTTLLASHQDQVVQAPSDATVWSRSDYCPIAGMLVGERAWTMQGHPEYTPAFVRALFESRRDRLGADAVDRAAASLATPLSNDLVADAIVDFANG